MLRCAYTAWCALAMQRQPSIDPSRTARRCICSLFRSVLTCLALGACAGARLRSRMKLFRCLSAVCGSQQMNEEFRSNSPHNIDPGCKWYYCKRTRGTTSAGLAAPLKHLRTAERASMKTELTCVSLRLCWTHEPTMSQASFLCKLRGPLRLAAESGACLAHLLGLLNCTASILSTVLLFQQCPILSRSTGLHHMRSEKPLLESHEGG